MDIQTILVLIIVTLALFLVLLIVYIILVLKEVKQTASKVNLVLDSLKEAADSVKNPIDYITTLSSGFVQGIKMVNTIKDIFGKKEEENDNPKSK